MKFNTTKFLNFLMESDDMINNDLWFDIKRDLTFPKSAQSENEIINHLKIKGACPEAMKALMSALRRFKKAV
jgi:hypothetical protein